MDYLGRNLVRSYGSATEGVLTLDSSPFSVFSCHEAHNHSLCVTMTFQGNKAKGRWERMKFSSFMADILRDFMTITGR